VSQDLRFLNICISKVLCLYFIVMQNFIVEYAEPSVLPRIHFSAEEKAKGAVDFLEPFLNSSTTTTTVQPSWKEELAVEIGQAIKATVPQVVERISSVIIPTGNNGENISTTTAPPLVSINRTGPITHHPVSFSKVKINSNLLKQV
jgi:hypothetical protein